MNEIRIPLNKMILDILLGEDYEDDYYNPEYYSPFTSIIFNNDSRLADIDEYVLNRVKVLDDMLVEYDLDHGYAVRELIIEYKGIIRGIAYSEDEYCSLDIAWPSSKYAFLDECEEYIEVPTVTYQLKIKNENSD